MKRLLHQFLCLWLVVSLMPGLGELLENAEHLLHDGHLAHAEVHDEADVAHNDGLEAEHGCSPMVHTCACHVTVPVVLGGAPDLPPNLARRALSDHRWPATPPGPSRAQAPPSPPPELGGRSLRSATA